MDIGKMDQPMGGFAGAEPDPSDFDPCRLKPFGIRQRQQRGGKQHRRQKPAPVKLWSFNDGLLVFTELPNHTTSR